MRVQVKIEGPRASGKTRLAQTLEFLLKEDYEVVFLMMKAEAVPYSTEIYYYEIKPR